jgi:hypothetical protein
VDVAKKWLHTAHTIEGLSHSEKFKLFFFIETSYIKIQKKDGNVYPCSLSILGELVLVPEEPLLKFTYEAPRS